MSESNKCCDLCERVGYTGEGTEIRCGNTNCPCHSIGLKSGQSYGDILPEHLEGGHSTAPSWEAEFDATFMVIGNHVPNFSEIYERGDVSKIKQFIQSLLDHQQAEAVAIGEELKQYNGHDFPIGTVPCTHCGLPPVTYHRERVVISKDEGTGGEVAEVTEKAYDIRGEACPKNPAPFHNQAIEMYQQKLKSLNS